MGLGDVATGFDTSVAGDDSGKEKEAAQKAANAKKSGGYSSPKPIYFDELSSKMELAREGVFEAATKGAAAGWEALERAYRELTTNEDLHKGVEFGAKAGWEVSKEVGLMTLEKMGKMVVEGLISHGLQKTKQGKAIVDIVKSPAGGFVKSKIDIARQINSGLTQYKTMVDELGQQINKTKKTVYK